MAQQTDDALEIYSGLLLENFEGYEDNDFAIWLEVGCELFHTLLGSGGAGKTRLAPKRRTNDARLTRKAWLLSPSSPLPIPAP